MSTRAPDTLPPFDVRFSHTRRRLEWTMRGFWTMADVGTFATALRDAVESLGPPPQRFDGLCDSRDFPVQSPEVSGALGMIDAAGAAMRQGRVAIVVGSTINKLQADRTLISPDVRIFLDMAAALHWLDTENIA